MAEKFEGEEWTSKEEERQDIVDGCIFELISEIVPLSNTSYEWNIEDIAQIREAVQDVVVNKRNLMTEQEFYPYRVLEAVENPDFQPEPEEMIVTDEQLVTAMKKVIEDLDADELAMLAGDALGGLCWFTNDGLYSFIPDEHYCGGLDFTKESSGN